MWAALAALTVPLPLILFTNWPVEYIYLIQLAVFALGVALLQWKPLRFAVVPKSVKHARAHERAVEEFLAQNLHTTKGRTGILIYVSLADHSLNCLPTMPSTTRLPRRHGIGSWRS
jgi:putative membrane protein